MLLLSSPQIAFQHMTAEQGEEESPQQHCGCAAGSLSALLSLPSAKPLKCVCPTELVLARGTWASAPSKTGLQAKMICKKHQGEAFLPSQENTSCLWDGIWKWKYKSVPRSAFARAAKSQPCLLSSKE